MESLFEEHFKFEKFDEVQKLYTQLSVKKQLIQIFILTEKKGIAKNLFLFIRWKGFPSFKR